MKFSGFHHIGLYCADAQKSLAFYKALGGTETFSFPMGDSGKTIHLVDMGGGAVVELIPQNEKAPPEQNARWAHICLVCGNVQAAYDLALSLGAQPRVAPQDVKLGAMSATNSFVLGPDDEVIEFFQPA